MFFGFFFDLLCSIAKHFVCVFVLYVTGWLLKNHLNIITMFVHMDARFDWWESASVKIHVSGLVWWSAIHCIDPTTRNFRYISKRVVISYYRDTIIVTENVIKHKIIYSHRAMCVRSDRRDSARTIAIAA